MSERSYLPQYLYKSIPDETKGTPEAESFAHQKQNVLTAFWLPVLDRWPATVDDVAQGLIDSNQYEMSAARIYVHYGIENYATLHIEEAQKNISHWRSLMTGDGTEIFNHYMQARLTYLPRTKFLLAQRQKLLALPPEELAQKQREMEQLPLEQRQDINPDSLLTKAERFIYVMNWFDQAARVVQSKHSQLIYEPMEELSVAAIEASLTNLTNNNQK